MNGHFSAMRNRLKISESNKYLRRDKIDKKKNRLLEPDAYTTEAKAKKLNLSKEEIEIILGEINEKTKKERKNLIINRVLIFVIIVLSILILSKL